MSPECWSARGPLANRLTRYAATTPSSVFPADADRRGERSGRGEIDEKGAHEDGRPDTDAQQQEGREGDPGRGPDGGGADGHNREAEAELARDEVDRGQRAREPDNHQGPARGP